jgi:hypothetical protein
MPPKVPPLKGPAPPIHPVEGNTVCYTCFRRLTRLEAVTCLTCRKVQCWWCSHNHFCVRVRTGVDRRNPTERDLDRVHRGGGTSGGVKRVTRGSE